MRDDFKTGLGIGIFAGVILTLGLIIIIGLRVLPLAWLLSVFGH